MRLHRRVRNTTTPNCPMCGLDTPIAADGRCLLGHRVPADHRASTDQTSAAAVRRPDIADRKAAFGSSPQLPPAGWSAGAGPGAPHASGPAPSFAEAAPEASVEHYHPFDDVLDQALDQSLGWDTEPVGDLVAADSPAPDPETQLEADLLALTALQADLDGVRPPASALDGD